MVKKTMTNLDAMKLGQEGLTKAMNILRDYRDKPGIGDCGVTNRWYEQAMNTLNALVGRACERIKVAKYFMKEVSSK